MPQTALMKVPKNGVTVRMYRIGHGDCFLLAIPHQNGGDRPVFVLIDCGYKPGSPDFVHQQDVKKLVRHIHKSTGGHLDLMIITHEHQDHVNAIASNFKDFQIDEAWFSWTEDPTDKVANELRMMHHDTLLGLLGARKKLAAAGEEPTALNALLSLELGGEKPTTDFGAKEADPAKSQNKQGMKLVRDLAAKHRNAQYWRPGTITPPIEGTGIRAFVFGPPRGKDAVSTDRIFSDEDPTGKEAFPRDGGGHSLSFGAAAKAGFAGDTLAASPFAPRYRTPLSSIESAHENVRGFYDQHYGTAKDSDPVDGSEVAANPAWRRIDTEWLYSAEDLALKMNTGVNNTSLVLAFELPKTKKILFFPGDAQRGNWHSWNDLTWSVSGETVTAKEVLGRTVLYKVGHHGSHNATLKGDRADAYANLDWMATSSHGKEFTAMITAVRAWAMQPSVKWDHPLPSIREALVKKAQGRVFQTDTDMDQLMRPDTLSEAAWDDFLSRTHGEDLYFDYTILDE